MKSTCRKFTIHTKAILFFSFITLWIPANARGWQQPSEKYKDAYKKYLDAACPIPKDSIRHFVYFARDRESIIAHPLLTHPMFKGAQIMYSWRNFEPKKDQYDFSILKEDYEYLKKYGKKLFIQLQDATFSPEYKAVPEYLYTSEYDGGAAIQYNDQGKPEGWVAKHWNKRVRDRFALLLQALGKEFDGEEIGVGLGGPDLMVTRKGQLNHAYTLMHEGQYTVPIGIAIQDGNYTGMTGADLNYNEDAARGEKSRNNIVPLLHGFAKDFLRVSYMFWVNQDPYFKNDVMPCFSRE